MTEAAKPRKDKPQRGEHNKIGFRNVDEQAEHDEAGSQGPGPGETEPNDDDGDAA